MIPPWASFFTEPRYEHFMQIVRNILATEAPGATLDEEEGTWREKDDPREYALLNLAQVCNQAPLDNWPTNVEHFVRTMRDPQALAGEDEDVATILNRLRVRLYPPEPMENALVVKVEIAKGLVACLALDYPDRIVTLNRDLARSLGKSSEELFDLGMANVQKTVDPEIEFHTLENGAAIGSITSDDFFTGTLALALDEYLPPEPELGYLVAIPNRHEILALAFKGTESLPGLPFLAFVGRDLFQKGPGSISPYVYWVRKRRWAQVELEETDDGLGVVGPPELIDFLD